VSNKRIGARLPNRQPAGCHDGNRRDDPAGAELPPHIGIMPAVTDAEPQIPLPLDRIKSFCAKWKVREFALFGSVLRDDFSADSDIDVLVSFDPAAPWSLYDLFDMRDELKSLFGRGVDLIEKEGLRNPFRRCEILTTRRVLYAA
jgi:predicted nucleotidyltransferase